MLESLAAKSDTLFRAVEKLYLDFYLTRVKIMEAAVFATAILGTAPVLLIGFGIIIYRILGECPGTVKSHEGKSVNRIGRYLSRVFRKAKGGIKTKYLHAIKSTAASSFLLGIMFSTILMSFSFMMGGMVDRMTVGYLNKVDYEYEAYLDVTEDTRNPARRKIPYLSVSLAGRQRCIAARAVFTQQTPGILYDEEGNDITVNIQVLYSF